MLVTWESPTVYGHNTAEGDAVNEAVPEINKVDRTTKCDGRNIKLERTVMDFDGNQHGKE